MGMILASVVSKYDNHDFFAFCVSIPITKHIPYQMPDKRKPRATHDKKLKSSKILPP